MNNRKKIIVLSIAISTALFSFAIFSDCKSDMQTANQLLSQDKTLNDTLTTQLKSCIKTLNDCDQYSYGDNCQHVYAKINTVSLPAHLPQLQKTSVHPLPTSQPITPTSNSKPITLPPQNNLPPTDGTTASPTPAQPTKQNNSSINWF